MRFDEPVRLPRIGTLYTSSWAGTLKQRVNVIGETPKRWRIGVEAVELYAHNASFSRGPSGPSAGSDSCAQ